MKHPMIPLAPIALFVYNRPWHTRQTVEALKKNQLFDSSDLIILSDGAKDQASAQKVEEVRQYLRTISGFKSVKIIERDCNIGLAQSIISGVTQVINEYGRVIVMEDDLVTSPFFLRYMNDALECYENEDKVISIHGYCYPISVLPETFFLKGADCWGWATWQRGWNMFEPDGEKLLSELERRTLEKEFNYDGQYDLAGMLRQQVLGKVDSWAIRWYASAFLKNKLTLYPGKSLVLNIGLDSSGTNCGTTDSFSGRFTEGAINVGGIAVQENIEVRSAVSNYFAAKKGSLLRRAIRKIRDRLEI